jgi:ketosteroid isomerase-like protein
MAFRRHDALARHQHDRISGQQADERESDDGNTEEGRDQDRKAPQKDAKHYRNMSTVFGS